MYTYVYKGVNWDTGSETICEQGGKGPDGVFAVIPLRTYVHEVLVELQKPVHSNSPTVQKVQGLEKNKGACKGVFYLIAVGGEHLLDAVGKGVLNTTQREVAG